MSMRSITAGGGQERHLAERYRRWARRRSLYYPFVGGMLEGIANDHYRQALREDDEAQIQRRLAH